MIATVICGLTAVERPHQAHLGRERDHRAIAGDAAEHRGGEAIDE